MDKFIQGKEALIRLMEETHNLEMVIELRKELEYLREKLDIK